MNRTYASIKRGLEQAIRHRKGKRVAGLRLHVPPQVDVKAVRERTGLTQEEFAATFAISLGALRHWERGDRKPHGTALVLLNVIAKDPTRCCGLWRRPERRKRLRGASLSP